MRLRLPFWDVAGSFMAAFPDMVISMDDVIECEDEHIEYHWTLDGKNTGPGGTGNHVRMSGFETWTMCSTACVASSVGTSPTRRRTNANSPRAF